MGILTCKERCKTLLHVSRRTSGVKMCDTCEYGTISLATYCPCCGKKYRTRKHGRKASERRLGNKKRM